MKKEAGVLLISSNPVLSRQITAVVASLDSFQMIGCLNRAADFQAVQVVDIVIIDGRSPETLPAEVTIMQRALPAAGVIILAEPAGKATNYTGNFSEERVQVLGKPLLVSELAEALTVAAARLGWPIIKTREKPPAADNRQGKIITVFSTVGGVGKTTLAINLALALAGETGSGSALVDADLQFGDVAQYLQLPPGATADQLAAIDENIAGLAWDQWLTPWTKWLKILPAPVTPEKAELVSGPMLTEILKSIRRSFRHVVVDTGPEFGDTTLAVLDESDIILVLTALDYIPTIKNTKIGLDVLESLGYSAAKVKLILNRARAKTVMDLTEIEEVLGRKFSASLPNDFNTVVGFINSGKPFVTAEPAAGISQAVIQLARSLIGNNWPGGRRSGGMVDKLKRWFK